MKRIDNVSKSPVEGMNTTEPNTLVINKYAYIFHWSHNNYFFSRQDYKQKTNIQNVLRRYCDNWSSSERIPYIIKDDTAYIEVDGIEISVNDTMIYSVSGQHPRKDIINGIKFVDCSKFVDGLIDFHTFCHNSIYHDLLKSLHIDIYGGDENLRFYRIYFKHNKYVFVVSNGKIYAHTDKYTEVSISDILTRLEAQPKSKAGKFIAYFCAFITK